MLTKRTAWAAVTALSLTACAEQGAMTSDLNIDAAHSIGVDGVISNGVIRSSSTNNAFLNLTIQVFDYG